MATCEWCWSQAFAREHAYSSKSQAEYYNDIVREQDAKGLSAECPNVREQLLRDSYRI